MIRFFPLQLVKCLFASVDALKIEINGIKDLVIGNASFNDVKLFMRQSFTAGCDIIKPFTIVSRKDFAAGINDFIGQFKDIHKGWLSTTNKSLPIVACLLFQRCEIEPHTEVQMPARMAYIGFRDDNIGGVVESHAVFRTPFLFIKSTRSSTMYSRENVCNTS